MDSTTLLRIHITAVMLFLLTYVIKTVLLFTSRTMLEKYSRFTKIPEIVISVVFLTTGIWLYIIVGGIKYMQILKLVFVIIAIPLAVVGFKNHKKGLALFALILIIGAYGLAEMSKNKIFIPKKVEVASADNSINAEGALIYYQNCVFCHGNDGKKMYRNAPDLTMSALNEDAIIQSVREGSKGKMPSYHLILSDENIRSVAKYVASLHAMKY